MGGSPDVAEQMEALQRGAVVVTGNERTARALGRAWDRLQRERGEHSWQSADVLSWRSWTHQLWRSLLLSGSENRLLLNELQEQRLWMRALALNGLATGLRSPETLAGLAADGWQRLWAYRGESRMRSEAGLSGDSASFLRWAAGFQEMCRRERLITGAELASQLAESLKRKELRTEGRELCVVGFDRLTPAQEELTASWKAAGGAVAGTTNHILVNGLVVEAHTPVEELDACAQWVRELLERRPAARVGLIVADAAGERDRISSVLTEALAPQLISIEQDSEWLPFEFSLGRALASQAMVRAALALLHWSLHALPLDRVSSLLLSRHFSDGDRAARAELDAALRHEARLRPEMTIPELLQRSGKDLRLARFSSVLRNMVAKANVFSSGSRSFAEWVGRVRGWLELAEWGGTSSVEYQLRERWERMLDTLATLDFAGETVAFAEVLRTLERLSREVVFAAESREAPVQVMDPLEAAGGRFDALWVLRSGEADWPPRTAAHPLLPWRLQRELGMPGTDAVRDRAAAKQMTDRLAASADEVVFSYARKTAEGSTQRAAAAVRMLGFAERSAAEGVKSKPARRGDELERVKDSDQLPALRGGAIRGGAALLKLQAACGFRAFAELRLRSTALAVREPGLNAMERGSAVHEALEIFWREVRSQERLLAMTEAERESTLTVAVEGGLRRARERSETSWDAAYLDVQRIRLTRLLRDWLAIERARPAFEVMQQEETRRDVPVGPLRLSVRLDRVDLVGGEQVVLDYKTGAVTTAAWLGDRPDEPQVPLYALLASAAAEDGPPLGAVGFAEVRAGKGMKLRGFQSHAGLLSDRVTPQRMDGANEFEGQVEHWHEVLHRLAQEFADGDARVRPKSYPVTCKHCEQRLLCRVDGSLLELQAANAQAADLDEEEALDG